MLLKYMYNISLLYAEKISCAVLPSHAPKLMLEGVSVQVVDPQSRECCLKGYAFLLEPENKVIVFLVFAATLLHCIKQVMQDDLIENYLDIFARLR